MTLDRLVVDGNSLTVEQLLAIGPHTQISLSEIAWEAVRKASAVVNNIINEGQVVYGINTGFGLFSEVVIAPEQLKLLQVNLIRSHASGVGEPMTQARTKRLLALRINVLAKGYSGISEETLRRLVAFFNTNAISKVPEQGTLGASGDLAPLSHLALGMLGDGEMWHPTSGKLLPAKEVIKEFDLKTLKLGPKEGIALINGTQLITALGAEALARAESLVVTADAITALSLETLQGTVTAYFIEIHKARPHAGQSKSARTLRSLLNSSMYPSKLAINHLNCGKVQDAYSLRCSPQVHGIVYDTIEFVKGILEVEMNSATDNPMVFSDTGRILSGGNFHGEYPAKALDYLTIAIHELSSISERRIERLVNHNLSGLPAFLVAEGGLNSGFMIAHCTAAALVSENKTLCFPASVDSIATSGGKEDHVSMGGWAARKCLKVVENVENVLAIEYLCAAQGLDLRRPQTSTEPIEALHTLLRDAGVKKWDTDRFMTPDIEIAVKLIREKSVLNLLQPYFAKWARLDPNNNYAITDKMANKQL